MEEQNHEEDQDSESDHTFDDNNTDANYQVLINDQIKSSTILCTDLVNLQHKTEESGSLQNMIL